MTTNVWSESMKSKPPLQPQDVAGNIRNNKRIPYHSPRSRLFLQDAIDNAVKARKTTIAENMGQSKMNTDTNTKLQPKNKSNDFFGDEHVNRNKLTVMEKILNPRDYPPDPPTRPGPRCLGEESLQNRRKYQGTLVLVGSGPVVPQEPDTPHIRCPDPEAMRNLERGRGGGMTLTLQHHPDYSEPARAPRLRLDEASDNYARNRGDAMAMQLDQRRPYTPDDRPGPRCPNPEALESLIRSRGCMGALMAGELESDQSRPVARVKYEAQDLAAREGNEVGAIMGRPQSAGVIGNGRASPAGPRAKFEGREIALQGSRGTLTSEQYNYNKMPTSPQAGPRVRPEAKEIASNHKGVATKNLFTKYGKLPGDDKPHAHIQSRARGIAQLSRGGAMKDCVNPSRVKHSKRRRAQSAVR